MRHHGASTIALHRILLFAILWASPHVFLMLSSSFVTVRLHDCFSLPLCLFPCGFHFNHSSPPDYVVCNPFGLTSCLPDAFQFFVTVRLHDCFGLPLCLFPCGVHFIANLVAFPCSFLRVSISHFLRFIVVATSSCPVLAHSSSFVIALGQKMPTI